MHPHLKHNLKLFGLVFFGAVVLLGIFLAISNAAKKSDDESAAQSTTSEVMPKVATTVATASAIDDQPVVIPSDWKQYKNDTLGFSFLYPTSWGDVGIIISDTADVHEFVGHFTKNKAYSFGGGKEICDNGQRCMQDPYYTGLKSDDSGSVEQINFVSNTGAKANIALINYTKDTANDLKSARFPLLSSEYLGVILLGPESNQFHAVLKSVKIY